MANEAYFMYADMYGKKKIHIFNLEIIYVDRYNI